MDKEIEVPSIMVHALERHYGEMKKATGNGNLTQRPDALNEVKRRAKIMEHIIAEWYVK